MNRFNFNRIRFFQALTVAAVLLLLLGAAYAVWIKHQRVQGLLADIAPRHARLQGLSAHNAELQVLAAKATEQLSLLTYPATQDVTKAGNDAQQRIRSLFADSRLDIISIQVLPAKENGKFDRIALTLRVEGDLAGIQTALEKLSTQTPVVTLDSMTLQTIGAVRPASIQRLSGQFGFSVFRLQS